MEKFSGITAFDQVTAKEIAEYWKEQGYEARIKHENGSEFWYVVKGKKVSGAKQYIFDTHEEANKVSNRLHQSGISSEIIKLDNGKYQLKIITGSGKIRELNIHENRRRMI